MQEQTTKETNTGRLYPLLKAGLILLLIIEPLSFILLWTDPDNGFVQKPDIWSSIDLTLIETPYWIAGALTQLPSTLLFMGAIFTLLKASSSIARFDFLSEEVVTNIKRSAWLWILYVPITILSRSAMSIALTFGFGEGNRLLYISINNAEFIALSAGVILLVFADAFSRAREQAKELSEFI